MMLWSEKMLFLNLLRFDLWPRRRQWHPTPVLLPGKSHGQRRLVSCSPWGHEELDMTEQIHFHFSLSWIGEGNDNPLQCSYLENPRDGGAWWAAISGVAQSQTRVKWLSSSSSRFVTQDVVYSGECSMCTWEESVFFCVWMNYPEDINETHLI